MGSLGKMVCHGGLSAMAIQVWQSNVWVKYMFFFFMCVIGGKIFSLMAKAKWFVVGSLGEMVCHAWNGEMAWLRWFVMVA